MLEGAGAPGRLASFEAGLFQVQDEGAQLVSHLLAPEVGERVLDACAGLGGKTLHLAQLMKNEGEIVAVDIDERKLASLEGTAARLGATNIRVRPHDATVPMEERFDRVLLDAPCSGTGVIRRRVDLKWRKQPEDIPRLAAMQLAMLEAAGASVAKGGVIVYAACSLEPEEGEGVIAEFLKRHSHFEPDDSARILGAMSPNDGPYLQTYPHRHEGEMDGFFAARLKRVS
jgi:16S rRNA (cytosine967-C5)-methyltransferase